MNYVEIEVVRYVASLIDAMEAPNAPEGAKLGCEHRSPDGRHCGEPAEYVVPDATRPGGGGQDVEQRPAMFCRTHLEEMLGYPPAEQPLFRRIKGPERGDTT